MLANFKKLESHPLFVPLLITVCGLLPVIGSFTAEYVFGLKPCHLCLYQRYLYVAVAAVGLASFVVAGRRQVLKAVVLLAIGLLIADGGVAIYHSLVERHIIKGPDGCTGGAEAGQSIEEIRAQIMGAELVRCDVPAATLLGLSFAEWNVMFAFSLAAACWFMGFRKVCRNE